MGKLRLTEIMWFTHSQTTRRLENKHLCVGFSTSQPTLLHQKPQLPNTPIRTGSPESQASDPTKFIKGTSAVAATTKVWPFSHGILYAYLIGTMHQEWLLKEHFHKTLLSVEVHRFGRNCSSGRVRTKWQVSWPSCPCTIHGLTSLKNAEYSEVSLTRSGLDEICIPGSML